MLAFLILAGFGSVAIGAEPINTAALLPTQVARPLLDNDPAVAAARANIEIAQRESQIIARSPYEWTANASKQRRSFVTAPDAERVQEWNVGLERTFRLPGKGFADRRLARATIDQAQGEFGDALHEAAKQLMNLWIDNLAAAEMEQLAATNAATAEELMSIIEKRVSAGDASKIDLNSMRADLLDQRRAYREAATQSNIARTRLMTRFPDFRSSVKSVPAPVQPDMPTDFYRNRAIRESDELKIARARLDIANAEVDRARADRIPDPTLGFFKASEAGGRERISGISFSIPISGFVRRVQSEKSLAARASAKYELERAERELTAQITSDVETARGAYESYLMATEGAAAIQETTRLTLRAHALGEADLPTLLMVRRQAAATNNAALKARVAAIKAYYSLLIDAHLVWDLEND
jgi:outer membrane protein TolC